MVKKPLVSIIIVNYKVREKLIECIESIEKYAPKISYEVIVVDNEGDQNLQTQLIAFKNATYIKSKSNLGFGAGNNLGASKARGEYLFFLNPDTLFVENVVDGLYKLIKSDNEIGIVAPKLLDLKRIEYPEQGTVELTPFKALLHLSFLSKFFENSSIISNIPSPIGLDQ